MNKQKTEEAIALTREILERYWQHDYLYALSKMEKDALWIGCTQEQFFRGVETIGENFALVDQELQSCHLKNQEYLLVHNSGNSCSVAGKYLVTTDPDTDVFLQVQQRCLVVWSFVDGELRIRGIHVSNPLGELKLVEEEKFPNHLGRQSYQYLMKHIQHTKGRKQFAVTDTQGVTHFIYEGEIQCIEAERHSIYIHLACESIYAKVSITTFLEEHADAFLRVHRSYAVNPMYISSITKNTILLDNGRKIAIPAKKKTEICESIDHYLTRENE